MQDESAPRVTAPLPYVAATILFGPPDRQRSRSSTVTPVLRNFRRHLARARRGRRTSARLSWGQANLATQQHPWERPRAAGLARRHIDVSPQTASSTCRPLTGL